MYKHKFTSRECACLHALNYFFGPNSEVLKFPIKLQEGFTSDVGVGRLHTQTACPVPFTASRHFFSIVLLWLTAWCHCRAVDVTHLHTCKLAQLHTLKGGVRKANLGLKFCNMNPSLWGGFRICLVLQLTGTCDLYLLVIFSFLWRILLTDAYYPQSKLYCSLENMVIRTTSRDFYSKPDFTLPLSAFDQFIKLGDSFQRKSDTNSVLTLCNKILQACLTVEQVKKIPMWILQQVFFMIFESHTMWKIIIAFSNVVIYFSSFLILNKRR